MRPLCPLVALLAGCLLTLACGSSTPATAPSHAIDGGATPDGGSSPTDAGTSDAGGEADAGSGSGTITGTYGSNPIEPIVAAYWIGIPDNAAETGGGPFVYLFSGPVTCADISGASGWVTSIPTGTQVTELLIGTIAVGTAVTAAPHAASNALEANHAVGGSATETRATSGTATLTAYNLGSAVDGTVDLTFPDGSAKGTFHAVWCPTGHEF